MKKLVSLILAMLILCACVVTVGAYEPIDETEQQKAVRAMLQSKLTEYMEEKTEKNSVTAIEVLMERETDGNKYYVVAFYSDDKTPKEFFYRMGIYAVIGSYEFPVFSDGHAVYTEADGQWHSLEYLYTTDVQALSSLAMMNSLRGTGTNDFNFVTAFAGYPMNITTATQIQKHLAGLEVESKNTVKYLDIDNDGEVTIKDATTLQKYIAGLEIYVHDSVV